MSEEEGSAGKPEDPPPGSFSTLFERNRDRFLGIARRYKGKRPEGGAETMDYVQDASAEYLKKPREVNSESHFLNLFAGFIKNAFRGKRRKDTAQKRGGGAAPLGLPTSSSIEADLTGPRTAAARSEDEDQVLAQLASLKLEDRQVITLRLWDDLSWEDIAARLELDSPEAARKRYARALDKLERSG